MFEEIRYEPKDLEELAMLAVIKRLRIASAVQISYLRLKDPGIMSPICWHNLESFFFYKTTITPEEKLHYYKETILICGVPTGEHAYCKEMMGTCEHTVTESRQFALCTECKTSVVAFSQAGPEYYNGMEVKNYRTECYIQARFICKHCYKKGAACDCDQCAFCDKYECEGGLKHYDVSRPHEDPSYVCQECIVGIVSPLRN